MINHNGFTLVEILLTLSISIILLSISLPIFNNFFLATQDKILQRQILESLYFARENARAKHIPIGVCKSNDYLTCSGNWEDGQIIFMDKNKDGIVHTKDQIIRVLQYQNKKGILYWRSYPKYRHYLLFLANGLLDHINGSFWYCHFKSNFPAWAIMLSKSGKIHSLYPNKNGVIKDGHGKVLQCHPREDGDDKYYL